MKTSGILMLLLLLLACNEIQTSEALSLPNFYPFGQSEGDLLIPQSDEGSSGTVRIPILFPFFDQNHMHSLFVNTNGVISFLVPISQHSPNAFPLGDNYRLVAPFWADVDTSVAGEVFYRGTTDATLLQQATNDVIATFADHRNFRATWLFVATWYKVAFNGAKGSYTSKRNTFQAVLITNGRHSFAIFNYNKITWTTGTSSSGDSSGLGGKTAQVGCNAGDGTRYFNIPGSGTHQVINLPNKSNVKNPGRWMYRIDSGIIQDGVCNTKDGLWTKLSPAPGCLPVNFYPFGQSEGDLLIPKNDDGSSGTVPIPIPFPFFDQNHNSLFVNNNGIISFLVHFSQYKPNAFPLGDNRRLVAPFWADVNTNVAGEVFYRGTTDATLLQQATNDVIATFADHRNFRATWLLVATWYKVAFYGATGSYTSKRNTFQAVLITNGRNSFAIFNYNKITWTTGTSSSGNSSGLGGTPAQAGFNAGDGTRYFNIPGSRTHEVIDLPGESNVNYPGRWMFRIDNNICNTKDGSWTKLSTTPVCFGANNLRLLHDKGLMLRFDKLFVPCGGELLAVKLVHLHGYITCSINSVSHRSHWGCGSNHSNIVVTTTSSLPAVLFNTPGYNSQSPELVLSVLYSPLIVTSGQELHLWYLGDGGNGGKSCCEVFARFK